VPSLDVEGQLLYRNTHLCLDDSQDHCDEGEFGVLKAFGLRGLPDQMRYQLIFVWLRHAKGRLVSLQLAFGWKSFGQVLT